MISEGHVQATAAYLFDQGICSSGNFLTSFLVARNMPADQFGVFALLNIVFIFSLTVNNWLSRASLSEISQLESKETVQDYTSSLGALVAGFGILPALILVCTAMVFRHPELCVALGVGAVAAQVQETMRRSAMAQARYPIALVGDAICYLGQAGLMFWAVEVQVLSLKVVFWTMAATSLMSVALQTRWLGLKRPSKLQAVFFQCWKHGRWITLSGLVLAPIVYGLPWIVEWTRGRSEAGTLSGLILVLGLSNPIMFSSTWLILVRGQAAKHSSTAALFRRVTPTIALTAVPLLLYWAVIFLFPLRILHLFYGHRESYTHLAGSLRLLTCYYLASYVAVCLEVLLDTRGQSRSRFWPDTMASLLVLSVGFVVAKRVGFAGLLCVGILVHAIRVLAYSLLLKRWVPSGRVSLSHGPLSMKEAPR